MLHIICCEELTHSLGFGMAFNSAKIAQLILPMSQIIEKTQKEISQCGQDYSLNRIL